MNPLTMEAPMYLTQAQLAAIYRKLTPGAIYLGDPPERWFRDVLIKAIRVAIEEES